MHRPALLALSMLLLACCHVQVVAVKPSLPSFLKFNPANDQLLRDRIPEGYQVVKKGLKGGYYIKTTKGPQPKSWLLDFKTISWPGFHAVKDKDNPGRSGAIILRNMGSEQECEIQVPMFEPPVEGIVNLLAWDYQQGFCIQVFSEERNYLLVGYSVSRATASKVRDCIISLAKGLNNLLDRGFFFSDFSHMGLRIQEYKNEGGDSLSDLKCAIDPSPKGRFLAQSFQDLNHGAYFFDFMTRILPYIMGLERVTNVETFVRDELPKRLNRFDPEFQKTIKALVAVPGSPDFVDFKTLLAKFGISGGGYGPKSAKKV